MLNVGFHLLPRFDKYLNHFDWVSHHFLTHWNNTIEKKNKNCRSAQVEVACCLISAHKPYECSRC